MEPIEQIGPYRVVRKIGVGGMGEVFEARHTTIERRVAVKVLRPSLAQNADLNTRFINEARAVNIVEHPGIVQIFDYGQLADGTAYIVMEFLNGVTLGAQMKYADGHLPLEDVVRFTRQIASVLAAAHGKGIIHRDLKPDNVMLIPDPDPEDPWRIRLKLLDFGVAKLASSLNENGSGTQNSLVIGTPEYMSPEQCRHSNKVTFKSDVYSLGVILFELLSGRVPFESDSATELMAKHMYEPLPRLQQLAPDAPGQLIEIAEQMLEKDPEKRPSVEQLLHLLESAASQLFKRPISSRSRLPVIVPVGDIEVRSPSAPTSPALVGSSDGSSRLYGGKTRGIIAAVTALGLVGFALFLVGSSSRKPVPGPPPSASPPRIVEKPAAAPGAPVPSAVPGARVRWTLHSEPPGARIIRVDNEEVLGQTPWRGEFERGIGAIVVRLELENYESRIVPLSRSQDVDLREPLTPVRRVAEKAVSVDEAPKAKPPKKPGKKRRIEEPEVEE